MKTVFKAAAAYFLALFGAGVVLGTIRALWIEPYIGSRAAELLEMPFMLAIMVFAARWVVRHMAVPPQARFRLWMGGLALALVLAVEFVVVLRLRGLTVPEYWANLDRVSGSVYYALLALYALLPLFVESRYFRHATAWGAAALAAFLFAFGYAGYRDDLKQARARIAHGSRIADTACGPIEYAEVGEGPAVLLVHGAGGGFDQGLEFADDLARRGHRVVAMSRFGYLRTPLPSDASAQAQADAHACLLDALRIDAAAIAGISAGAPSSVQFALRHPDRTTALVLLVPLAYRPGAAAEPAPVARFMYEHAVRSNVLYWLALRLAPGLVVKTILATPPEVVRQARPEEQQRVARLMEHILPLRERHAGLVNDAVIAQKIGPDPLERITAPTLVISLADDLYGTYESARYTAAQIPGARFISYKRGGHVWVDHHHQIVAELHAFLASQDPPLARR